MPSGLALLICTVGVLFLLLLERNQRSEVSFAMWLPTVWMLLIAGKTLAAWFGTWGEGMEDGSPLDRNFIIGVMGIGLLILLKRRFVWSRVIKEQPWLLLLIVYMLVSVLWSNIPFISFKRWMRELAAVIMAFLVATEQSPMKSMESILRRTAYILIPFSMLLIKYFPDIYGVKYDIWTGTRSWVGVTLQKNSLSRLCMIAAFFLIWALVRRWRERDIPVVKFQSSADLLVLSVTLWILKGPPGVYSATALATLMAGLVTFVSLLWMKKRRITVGSKTLVTIITFLIVFGSVTVITGGSDLGNVVSVLGRDKTLTGRSGIWAGLVPVAMQHPILGKGFGGFWTTETVKEHWDSEAHSGYLDVFLGLGIVGLVLTTMFLLSCARKFQKELTNNHSWASLCICYLIMAVLHNITESSIHTFASQLMAVVLFLAVSLSKNREWQQQLS